MTDEERNSLRAIIHEEIAAAEQRLTAATSAASTEMRERQDGAIESIATAISELRSEISDRMTAFERRLDNAVAAIEHIGNRISLMTRYEDRLDKDNTALTANYHALQRDIRELRARLEALEKKAS